MRHFTGFNPTPRPLKARVGSRSASSPTVSEAVTQSPVAPNPYVGPIPTPVIGQGGEFKNLGACVVALKDAVESLSGQRGDPANRAVIFKDLVDYGILSEAALGSANGVLSVAPRSTVVPYGFTPADLAGTNSTTGVMLGLGITVTTGLTGSLLVGVTGAMQLTGTVEANTGHVEVRVSSDLVAVPANGAAPSGVVVGTPLDMTELANIARQPFAYTAVHYGFDPLTPVWLDLVQAVSAGDVALFDLNITVLGV